jgi:iron complex outermembrane receptor protein
MSGKIKHTAATLARALALLCLAPAAWGQAAELTARDLVDLSFEELMQIEVSVASHIPTDTLNAASSAEVIPEEAWTRRGARNISDVLATVPGVAVLPSLSGGDAIGIRGYTRTTSVLGVLLTWDGVPLNDLFRGAPTLNLPGLNLGAIDEIQIIRGPGSSLYGSDAFHGVVALNGFEADASGQELHGDVRSNGFYAAGTRLGTSLGEQGRASFALVADGQPDQDLDFSYLDPLTEAQRAGERDNRYAAQSASFKLRGESDAVTSWHGGVLLHHYDGEDFQGFGTRLAGTRDLGGIDTNLVLGNGGMRRELGNGAAFELSAYAWRSDSVLTAGRTEFDFESANTQRRVGAHATFEKAFAARNTELAFDLGLEELAVEEARTRNYDLSGELTLDIVNPAQDASRRIYSASFEGTTHWSAESWRVVYGARFDRYSDFGDRVSPRLGLIWHPREDNAIKLLYGNAFRAPTANDIKGTPGLIEANENLAPEIIDTLELVYMHQLGHAFTELTLFYSRWKDGIVSIANDGGAAPFIFTNSEQNSAYGLTWGLVWQLDPWLVDLGVSWVRSENDTLDENYDAFPRFILDAELSYRHAPWATRFYLVQHWQLDSDDVFPPSAGFAATPLPDYSRTDVGMIRTMTPTLSLTLLARNLFDRDNFHPSTAGSRGGIPDESRTLSAQIRFVF